MTRAADHVFVGIPGPSLDSRTAELLERHRPGGVILFGRNIEDEVQLDELVTHLRRLLPDVILAVDAEGGRVDRLRDVVGPAPAPADLARHAPSLAYQAGCWIGRALRLFDVDVDFAPVVDLDRRQQDNALDERYLGATADEIVPRALAFLNGLHAGGVGGCIKHFPGLGGAGEDTHYHMSCVYLPAEELRADLEPFAELAPAAGAVMVGHAIYPAYDGVDRPATLSPPILGGLLRGRLGFEGLAFSDDMEMKALANWGGDLAECCEIAFASGCDVLLACHTLEALPGIVARLEAPGLAARLEEAGRRLESYRHRLATLRSAREYVAMMKEGSRGERLEAVRGALEQIRVAAA